jgi:hypothetical protein
MFISLGDPLVRSVLLTHVIKSAHATEGLELLTPGCYWISLRQDEQY